MRDAAVKEGRVTSMIVYGTTGGDYERVKEGALFRAVARRHR